MSQHTRTHRRPPTPKRSFCLVTALLLSSHVQVAQGVVYPSSHELYKFDYLNPRAEADAIDEISKRVVSKRENPIPLIVTNSCGDTIWPGIATQGGDGPESSGFELASGETRDLTVGPTWAGRVWGRTNCTISNDTATCSTGDCFGMLECGYSGAVPATLAEFNLAGGTTGRQTFYDISLVDGYNLPVGVVYHPADNTSNIPPNFVNAACIATSGYLMAPNRTGYYYTNSSYPMPYESQETNPGISNWCPWDLQAFPPDKPGDGIYPYPDDNIERPVFDPCKSACAATNSESDCCTGDYNDPNKCKRSEFSDNAKAVCPDAYSFAYDDQTSTFIIPSGGGWEVVFCPEGRSTNILATYGAQLSALASTGEVTEEMQMLAMNTTYIDSVSNVAVSTKNPGLLVTFTAILAGLMLF
ncbi:thaumatin family protein [Truncatella angustata]|uniref:Thaumatin family protein n=1 Tax=Truncatella angustata TaxID=152316 RepID=A0A9P8RIV4_9PEZI|nr:thaumatin family protein [Truncatella angustata]KAH6646854.1 thaumatin family protein [Truncatella angustata]